MTLNAKTIDDCGHKSMSIRIFR